MLLLVIIQKCIQVNVDVVFMLTIQFLREAALFQKL